MDTAKGELSFAVNGVDYGVAYDGIPLDKPLVPCIIIFFYNRGFPLTFSIFFLQFSLCWTF